MNFFKMHLMGMWIRIMKFPRRCYHKQKAKRNRNHAPTIICNNCTAGVMLHDLGLKFNTPTINLDIRNQKEFLYFVENLEDLKDCPIEELSFEKYHLPAGVIIHNGHTIDIVFTHYKTFEIGVEKWHERMKRINMDNLFVIFEAPEIEKEILERFSRIKYRKCVLSKQEQLKYDFYYGFDMYKDWKPGKFLQYKSVFSLKRYLDDFDYISFLNT